MLAPETPPRVGSKVAPVTRVSVRAARGIEPVDRPIPFRVLRLDSDPAPSIDGPLAPTVTLDIVPAIALRSPARVGGTWPLTPSRHFSAEPGSSWLGPTELSARTGFLPSTLTASRVAIGARVRVKLATSSRSSAWRWTRRRADVKPVALT